jgi:hypothetical protein
LKQQHFTVLPQRRFPTPFTEISFEMCRHFYHKPDFAMFLSFREHEMDDPIEATTFRFNSTQNSSDTPFTFIPFETCRHFYHKPDLAIFLSFREHEIDDPIETTTFHFHSTTPIPIHLF